MRASKNRFIPFRKHDLVEMCLTNITLQAQEDSFRQMVRMLDSVFHYEFHQRIERLKNSYSSVDPDSDTLPYPCLYKVTKGDDDFPVLLAELLEKANYQPLNQGDIHQAMQESSLFKIRLQVDFDDFSEQLLFCRGESIREERLTSCLGLFSKTIRFTHYDRVVIYIRFKDGWSENPLQPDHMAGRSMLKLFCNVPKADLEMLFPNTQVRMRMRDKLLIGVPAIISGGIVLTTKLSATLLLLGSLLGFWLGLHAEPVNINNTAIVALLAGAATLATYIWKQFANFKNRKLRFMQELTKNLYFKNLDNNAGVLFRITNDAEEEEVKEALLAYFILFVADKPLSRQKIDTAVEAWLKDLWQCDIDFEIDDALNKLLNLGVVKHDRGFYRSMPLSETINVLECRWNKYFSSTATM
ncbi:TMEM143 family protein [Dasania sp. GY-MA-18]|uniref:TMEM143 family protein n=1 Tax=Dasania phycosphaerae TaxID=2950436 RepID=A0A9J6RGZ6_9GAMM|nr:MULTISPECIES: TMEM143 family protein [Dasania]MCR8921190.1 TMEM143 family protein [Dasania sp. GY-MA-18]MCZ0863618.1 TMEM143 family protein [Dasania phycosphaerae]MCZ0867346.1 TMEM143 family protein [Dasania phycosphaerae]